MEKIKEILSSLGGIPSLSEAELSQFDKLAEILAEENKKVNVTSITDPVGIALKHFADSLSILELDEMKPEGITLADIGCGGGFPGLPIKIMRSDIRSVMVDSTAKKIRYVAETAKKLGLVNTEPTVARAEELSQSGGMRESFDIVTARALARLNVLSELCLPLVRVGGHFISMKAASAEEELAEAKKGIGQLGGRVKYVKEVKFDAARLDMSLFTDEERAAVDDFMSAKRYMIVIEKVSHTPSSYPRQYARITKKPL